MKFYKAMREKHGCSMVEADGEPWEKDGVVLMLEIPADLTDCELYEMAGTCNRCIMRHRYPCQLDDCMATEKASGLLVTKAGSKSALIRALNRLDYDEVRKAAEDFVRRNGIQQPAPEEGVGRCPL